MITAQEIEELKDLLRLLKIKDREYRVFGADIHHYELASTLTENELIQFEQHHRCQLPPDYRDFLINGSDGGAGPYYGLATLTEAARDRDLSRPFSITKSTTLYSQAERAKLGLRISYTGLLELCHQGCAIYSYLVVNGPTYGTIWDGREDFYPTELSFSDWYRRWIKDLQERALPLLENERVVSKIKVGMKKSEVITICNGQGQEKEIAGMTFLSFRHLRTQFELNEAGEVKRIIYFHI
jgi:hypothetical protein